MEKAPIALSAEMDWQKEFRLNGDGSTTSTIRGLARVIDIDEKALRRHFKEADISPSELAEKLIQQGFDLRTFCDAGVPELAGFLCIEHYAFDAGKRCTAQALAVYRSFGRVGYRYWIYTQLGQPLPSANADLLRLARQNTESALTAIRQRDETIARLETENRVLRMRADFVLPQHKPAPRITNEEKQMMGVLHSQGFSLAAISRCFKRAYQTVRRHAI